MTRRKKHTGLPPVDVTPTKRKAIVMYHEREGRSFHWIANNADEFKDTAADHTTISRNYHTAKEFGCYSRNKDSGRPHRFTKNEMDTMVQAIDKGEVDDRADLQREMFSEAPQRTIRRNLQEHDRHGFVRRKKPFLSITHIAERHAFTRVWSDWRKPVRWNETNETRVIFSDESRFCLNGLDGLRWCRKPRREGALEERNISQRVRRGLGSGNVTV